MRLKVASILGAAVIIAGCSGDISNMVPDFLKVSAGKSASSYTVRHGKKVFNVIRDGVTFSDGSYITPQGEGDIILPRGYYYVSSFGGRVLIANKYGDMQVLKSDGTLLASTKLKAPLVTGVAYDRGVAYLAQGNRIGLYDPFKNRVYYEKELKGGIAIDNRLANPVVTNDFILVPTLDGNLVLITLHEATVPKVIPVSGYQNNGNVIYARVIGGRIIVASANVIQSLSSAGKHSINLKVADITTDGNYLYVATRDGNVIQLTLDLQEVMHRKFNYADFATIAVRGDKIFVFAKSGSLVVLSKDMQKYKIYSVGSARSYSYVSGNWLYIDDKKVNLDMLNYE